MPRPALSELVAPSLCGMLFIEAQWGVLGDTSGMNVLVDAARSSGAIANMARLAVVARDAGVPVIHCTMAHFPGEFGRARNTPLSSRVPKAGSAAAADTRFSEPIPELGPEPGDVTVVRPYGLSHMTTTHLDSVLRVEGITTVVIAGVSVNVAVTNLVLECVHRGYQVVVPRDAVVGYPVEYGEQVVEHSLRLLSTVSTTDELVSTWS